MTQLVDLKPNYGDIFGINGKEYIFVGYKKNFETVQFELMDLNNGDRLFTIDETVEHISNVSPNWQHVIGYLLGKIRSQQEEIKFVKEVLRTNGIRDNSL